MVSSGDLPDFLFTGLDAAVVLDYGVKGALIPLNKYLNDPVKSPNFAAISAADKNILLRSMTSADGNIYQLKAWGPEYWNFTPYRLMINQAWLTKLGLKMPSTTEDLRNVLIAFRDRDPNGNGRKDELGLFGRYAGATNTIATILNSFIFYNPNNLSLDGTGKKIATPFTDPAFRKGLVYLNSLYKEGLIEASMFTDDNTQFMATLSNTPNIVGFTGSNSANNWSNFMNNPNFKEMAMIPPLTGPDGVSYTPYNLYEGDGTFAITSKCKNPDLAFKVMESFYSREVSMAARYGEEGVDWTRKPEDFGQASSAYIAMGLYPKLTFVVLRDVFGMPEQKNYRGSTPWYFTLEDSSTFSFGKDAYNPNDPNNSLRAQNYKNYIGKWPEHLLPSLKYTFDESQNIAMSITNINEYVSQSIAEFVTGVRNITNDAAWNAYLRELDNMGLKQWVSTAQTAYDRQNK
jgi:putative aldouronate transport system substrate-binding protein